MIETMSGRNDDGIVALERISRSEVAMRLGPGSRGYNQRMIIHTLEPNAYHKI